MFSFVDINKIVNNVSIKTNKALEVVGAQSVTEVAKQVRKNKSVDTSNLINSITFSTSNKSGEFSGKTNGRKLNSANSQAVKVGTTVVYAPRVEFGFVGKDSLGRNINQPAKPFLRPALIENKEKLNNLFSLLMKRL